MLLLYRWCHLDGYLQKCGISKANALEIPQSCALAKQGAKASAWIVLTLFIDGIPHYALEGQIFFYGTFMVDGMQYIS